MEFKNSWKDSTAVFQRQLSLNISSLAQQQSSSDYPPHWISLFDLLRRGMEIIDIKKVLDIGCGCGACKELIRRVYPQLEYTGMDYSEKAIEMARLAWGGDYRVKDLWEITPEDVAGFDLVHSDALLEVLPNGDEGLAHILSLNAKSLLLNRVQNGDKENHYTTYDAYDILPTYSYYFNRKELLDAFKEAGYVHSIEIRKALFSTFFLWKDSSCQS